MSALYRANFGDGTWTKNYTDIRDARVAIWGRAARVQYRSFIERFDPIANAWEVVSPSRAMRNGPPIVEQR